MGLAKALAPRALGQDEPIGQPAADSSRWDANERVIRSMRCGTSGETASDTGTRCDLRPVRTNRASGEDGARDAMTARRIAGGVPDAGAERSSRAAVALNRRPGDSIAPVTGRGLLARSTSSRPPGAMTTLRTSRTRGNPGPE